MTTLADIAREQGVTPQAVAKWRDLAVGKYGELPFDQVGKRKEYEAEAVEKILEFATNQSVQPSVKVFPPADEPFTTGAMVVAPTVDVVSANGYGKRFDLGPSSQEVHLHVHLSNAGAYQEQAKASDETVQNLIHSLFQQAEAQGIETGQEIHDIVQSVRSKLIETEVRGIAKGKNNAGPPADSPPADVDGLNDSAGQSQ